MSKPTESQRILFAALGLRCPATRAEASTEQARLRGVVLRGVVVASTPEPDAALRVLIEEYKRQIADLRRLVRYQKLDIARLKAGEAE